MQLALCAVAHVERRFFPRALSRWCLRHHAAHAVHRPQDGRARSIRSAAEHPQRCALPAYPRQPLEGRPTAHHRQLQRRARRSRTLPRRPALPRNPALRAQSAPDSTGCTRKPWRMGAHRRSGHDRTRPDQRGARGGSQLLLPGVYSPDRPRSWLPRSRRRHR